MEYQRKTVIRAEELRKILKDVPDDAMICFKNVAGDNITVNDYSILIKKTSNGKEFKKLIFDNTHIEQKREQIKNGAFIPEIDYNDIKSPFK